MRLPFKHRFAAPTFLTLCCIVLTLLWLPGIRFPVVSDTINYAKLGQSLWEQGTYTLNGEPYTKHLPFHALLSYPLTQAFGVHLGMHLSTLLGGFGVLIATFLLTRRLFGNTIAAATTIAVLIHPGFILMSMLGSADLLFTTLFLLSLFFYVKADEDKRFYLLAGAMAGCSCLTRYNGVPLFALFLLFTAWKRRSDLRSGWFWGGLLLGSAIFSIWLIRNTIVFGNPLYSGYTGELEQEAPNLFEQMFSNSLYYGNPIHNVFPFFFVFAIVGVFRYAKKQTFLFWSMLAAWAISMIWWVQAIRFMFPGYPLLLIFAVLALIDTWKYWKHSLVILSLIASAGIGIQSLSLCLYTYGDCNAWFDRTIGMLPKNMGLTPEGFYAWHLARNYINARAEKNAFVFLETPEYAESIFRKDLRATDDVSMCPLYRITQKPEEGERVVFRTDVYPQTSVTLHSCIHQ